MLLDLDAIEQRCNAATPGPWHQHDAKDVLAGSFLGNVVARVWPNCGNQEHDSAFIAFAREDVPAIIARVRADAEVIAQLRERYDVRGKALEDSERQNDELAAEANEFLARAEKAEAALRELDEKIARIFNAHDGLWEQGGDHPTRWADGYNLAVLHARELFGVLRSETHNA